MSGDLPLFRRTAAGLAAMVATRQTTPGAIARAMLKRIDQTEDVIKAWAYVDRDDVLADASDLDREAAAGRLRGPLHGVPVGVKDIYDVAGVPTRAGSRVRDGAAPAVHDSAPVARLRSAGALILGKTATTEFASADPAATRNPWAPEHTPGGSSSGSAAAVAAGMTPVAMGSQTAGSVLRPAAFCGIVGFKPSFGRIPIAGVLPFAWSLDTMGTLTRTVADAALLFGVLSCGADALPAGPTTMAQIAGNRTVRPRIGYVAHLLQCVLDPRMDAMLAHTAARLEQAGAAMREVTLPADFPVALDAQHLIMIAEGAAYHARSFAAHADRYGPHIRALVEAGLLIPAASYLEAQRVRSDLRERVLPLLRRYDALLVPAAAGPAPHGLDSTGNPAFNAPWTMFGLPAISLYAGTDGDGLPLGIQLVGRPGADEQLLETAAWCETALGAAPWPPERALQAVRRSQ